MQNTFSISGASPGETIAMVTQLLSNPTPFKAIDAVYAHNMADSIADFGRHPLVIDGTIGTMSCIVRVANIDLNTGTKILNILGFNTEELSKQESDRFVKFFRNI